MSNYFELSKIYDQILNESKDSKLPPNKKTSKQTKKVLDTKPFGDKKMEDNWDNRNKRTDIEDSYTLKEYAENIPTEEEFIKKWLKEFDSVTHRMEAESTQLYGDESQSVVDKVFEALTNVDSPFWDKKTPDIGNN